MKVRVFCLEANACSFHKGKLENNIATYKKNKIKRKSYVLKVFPRQKRSVFGQMKTLLYCVVMDGESRSLAYMDDFDSDAFEAFMNETMLSLEKGDIKTPEVMKKIFNWVGPDNQIDGLEAEPWLLRRFRAAPVTDEHFHRVITDQETAKMMRGEKLPLWLFALVAMAIAMVGMAMAIYGLVNRPVIVGNGEDFEVLEGIIGMWWYGRG